MKLLITGGAGFIGSAACRCFVHQQGWQILIVDKLTYAGQRSSLESVLNSPQSKFLQIDICDRRAMQECLDTHQPDTILHLAAETHVDRSIEHSEVFVDTNVIGTYRLLEACREYLRRLDQAKRKTFRFVYLSTDEVYGSCEPGIACTELYPLFPSSPYAASKAAAEHMVMAWHRTYGLPVIVVRCTNNYGPHQLPEKFIPLMIIACVQRRSMPVYGDGSCTRDWLFVDDHVRALVLVIKSGRIGEVYNVATQSNRSNLEVVQTICDVIQRERLLVSSPRSQITFVSDRPGHDQHYVLDTQKIRRELGWFPCEQFEQGIEKTIKWYLENETWWKPILRAGVGITRIGLTK